MAVFQKQRLRRGSSNRNQCILNQGSNLQRWNSANPPKVDRWKFNLHESATHRSQRLLQLTGWYQLFLRKIQDFPFMQKASKLKKLRLSLEIQWIFGHPWLLTNLQATSSKTVLQLLSLRSIPAALDKKWVGNWDCPGGNQNAVRYSFWGAPDRNKYSKIVVKPTASKLSWQKNQSNTA